MSAERLRRVAAEMREYAEAATPIYQATGEPVPWHTAEDLADNWDPEDARHIAAWSPPVALAVADWLDSAASAYVEDEPIIDAALALCDAWEARP